MEAYKADLREREAKGTGRRGPNGEMLDLESRQVAAMMNNLSRHITADEATSAALSRRESEQLALAIDNFTLYRPDPLPVPDCTAVLHLRTLFAHPAISLSCTCVPSRPSSCTSLYRCAPLAHRLVQPYTALCSTCVPSL